MLAYSRYWSVVPSAESFRAAAQTMMTSVSLGLSIAWPLYRFSMRMPRASRWLPILDWLAIAGTLQVVLWPMRLSTHWTPIRVALLDSTLCAWALLIGALISIGLRDSSPWARTKWMAICIAVVLLAPIADITLIDLLGFGTATLTSAGISELLYWSPVSSAWVLAGHDSYGVTGPEWARVALLLAAAILTWAAAVLWPTTTDPPQNNR
ncbi:MAG: hypothetical protein D8M59_13865 [Planctomycetes bacterium]|nr:hypothetical protein [Planctomycetota bacterium]NOG55594.1 hypothetical protein [Planctomycetota bacterium]